MRTVAEIYAEYRIMPLLQLHQLRVAAVAKTILQHFDEKLDERNLITACLFHDMGNILKSDFSIFPETLEPEGLPYWQKVKEDFARRYGPDVHHATIAIGHELHLPLQAMRYIDGVGFSKLHAIVRTPVYEQKIIEYADCRVAPHGVVSLAERLEEARARYAHKYQDNPSVYDEHVQRAQEIERQIFSRCTIKPEEITEERVQPVIEELRHFQVT